MVKETREQIQAVVLADSFSNTFRPLTLEVPKVLLPLVNVPMLEYTLEWLASQNVDEIFVLCCAHAEMIDQYLQTTRWHACTSPKIHISRSDTVTSAGDALREIYERVRRRSARSFPTLCSADRLTRLLPNLRCPAESNYERSIRARQRRCDQQHAPSACD